SSHVIPIEMVEAAFFTDKTEIVG
ncbi:hypothetical protein EVA_11438, partial [gut metagenome]